MPSIPKGFTPVGPDQQTVFAKGVPGGQIVSTQRSAERSVPVTLGGGHYFADSTTAASLKTLAAKHKIEAIVPTVGGPNSPFLQKLVAEHYPNKLPPSVLNALAASFHD